jgi:hypothetical protein
MYMEKVPTGAGSHFDSLFLPGDSLPGIRARRCDDTEAVSAKHQPCPYSAVHIHPDRILQIGRCIERAFRSRTLYEERLPVSEDFSMNNVLTPGPS